MRVQGLGFRVQGLGVRVQCVGFRLWHGGSWSSPRVWDTTRQVGPRDPRFEGYKNTNLVYCPHTVRVYSIGLPFANLIYLDYEYYSTVTEWGQHPT